VRGGLGQPIRQNVVYPVYDAQGCLKKTIAIDVDATKVSKALEEKQAHIARLENDLKRLTRIDPTMESLGNDSLPVPLTGRELQVLRLMARGATNTEISELLSISHHTVKSHVIHIFNKLGVDDRTEASVWAAHHSLVWQPTPASLALPANQPKSLLSPPNGGFGVAVCMISIVIHPLPKVPVLIRYWKKDGDFDSALTLLFDATACENLGIERLYMICVGLVTMFERIALTHGGHPWFPTGVHPGGGDIQDSARRRRVDAVQSETWEWHPW
jgi:DNA-binding CsgD family transcriptional regulator